VAQRRFPPHYWLLAIHFQMASSPFESHSREMLRVASHPRSFSHRGQMNKALNEVRAGESRRMASEGLTPVLKKSRWLLLKR
ncbi:MAG: hypothetical protein ABI759_24065, partial [Candidatus Solibacter sp.]